MVQHTYQEKLAQLLELAGPEWSFRQHRAEKKKRIWELAGTYIRNITGNFFRVALLEILQGERVERNQAVVLEESDSFNKYDCHKQVGRVMLPIRRLEGFALQVGLTCSRSVGSHGEALIMAPRSSNSNPEQLPKVAAEKVIYSTKVRLNPHRLTGQVLLQVVQDVSPEELPEKIVWFDIDDLVTLLEDPRFCENSTRQLALWVIARWALQNGFNLNGEVKFVGGEIRGNTKY